MTQQYQRWSRARLRALNIYNLLEFWAILVTNNYSLVIPDPHNYWQGNLNTFYANICQYLCLPDDD